MKFPCPYCRRECDFEEMQMDADLHAIIKILPTFGAHANLVAAYTELFGISPLKTRRKKWRLLLEEMKRLFDAESFDYNRRRYNISRSGIAEALNIVVYRHWDSHLENHNYLKKVMIGIAEALAKTDSREAEKDLRKCEERLRYPYPEEQVEPPVPSLDPSRPGREKNGGRSLKDSPPLTGGDKGEGERQERAHGGERLTDAQRLENIKRVGDIIRKIGG